MFRNPFYIRFKFVDFKRILLKNLLVTRRWSRLKVSRKISSVKSQAIRIGFQDRLKLACSGIIK
jgi:hypothetical protein